MNKMRLIATRCFVFLIIALCCVSCAKSPEVLWQEQYDLGVHYLESGDYEQAILAFEAAIEIDPRSAQAYAGLYAAYIAQGDTEKADETWAAMLKAGVSVDDMLPWIERMADVITEGGGGGEAVKQTAQEKACSENESVQSTGTDGTTPAYIALQGKQIEISITPTDIPADSVINFDGYGSLAVNGDWGQVESGDMVHMGYTVPPQAALIDRSGEFVFPYLDTESRYFYSDGVVSLFDRSTSVFLSLLETEPEAAHGYFGVDGTRLLQMEEMADADFAELHPFGDGVAFVRLCGEFDSYGQTIYEGADGNNHVIGTAGYGKKCIASYLIDRQGNVLFAFPKEFSHIWDWEFDTHIHTSGVGWSSEGLIPVSSLYRFGGHVSDILNPEIIQTDMSSETWAYGFMDHSGNMVIPQIYSAAGNFSEGLAAVCGSDGLWGYIDKAGDPVIPFTYDGAGSFADGLAPVSKNGKTGYINAQNEAVIPFEYEDGFGAGGGVCTVAKNGKYGLIDYNGNEVLPFEYDDISTCAEGVAYAIKDGVVYIISVG